MKQLNTLEIHFEIIFFSSAKFRDATQNILQRN